MVKTKKESYQPPNMFDNLATTPQELKEQIRIKESKGEDSTVLKQILNTKSLNS